MLYLVQAPADRFLVQVQLDPSRTGSGHGRPAAGIMGIAHFRQGDTHAVGDKILLRGYLDEAGTGNRLLIFGHVLENGLEEFWRSIGRWADPLIAVAPFLTKSR